MGNLIKVWLTCQRHKSRFARSQRPDFRKLCLEYWGNHRY